MLYEASLFFLSANKVIRTSFFFIQTLINSLDFLYKHSSNNHKINFKQRLKIHLFIVYLH